MTTTTVTAEIAHPFTGLSFCIYDYAHSKLKYSIAEDSTNLIRFLGSCLLRFVSYRLCYSLEIVFDVIIELDLYC